MRGPGASGDLKRGATALSAMRRVARPRLCAQLRADGPQASAWALFELAIEPLGHSA